MTIKECSAEQEGLVAVIVKSYEEKSSDARKENYFLLELSDGGAVRVNSLHTLRLMRQINKCDQSNCEIRSIELIAEHLVKSATPIIVRRVTKLTLARKLLWDYTIPTDIKLL